jgi:acetyl esterase/lipase
VKIGGARRLRQAGTELGELQDQHAEEGGNRAMSDVLISTIEYGTGGGRPLTMHLLRARPRPAGLAPGLIWVHGGAWLSGSKDSGIARLFPFARRGPYPDTDDGVEVRRLS